MSTNKTQQYNKWTDFSAEFGVGQDNTNWPSFSDFSTNFIKEDYARLCS